MHFAGIFVSEQGRSFHESHGKIAVAAFFIEINLILEGTGHGTESEAVFGIVVRIAEDEHAVEIVIPVSRDFIKFSLGKERSFGEFVPFFLFDVFNPAL